MILISLVPLKADRLLRKEKSYFYVRFRAGINFNGEGDSMHFIDCRGLNCPEPVLKTKQALDGPGTGEFEVIVDNETARENVIRFAKSRNRNADWKQEGDLFRITVEAAKNLDGDSVATVKAVEASESDPESPVLLICNDAIGAGSAELGQMLMRNFIYTLTKRDNLPKAIIFMNTGVKLCVEDSPALDELNELESKDVRILACGTCLDYYNLKDALSVGEISNMYDIADMLMNAGQAITV